jgi:hypothetical protein
MPRYRYYYEYDPEEGVFQILEEDGGQEHGHYYDVLLFCTPTKEDAEDAIKVLVQLAMKEKK